MERVNRWDDDSTDGHQEYTERRSESKTTMKLDQFLKWRGVVQTGGEAKLLIQDGQVTVNGQLETRRGRKLQQGDRVSLLGEQYQVEA